MLQGPGVDPSQVASDVATQVDPQRRFIRTAQAQFQVKDVYRTALAIEDEVASQGGFVVDNEISSQVQRVLSRPLAPGKRLELTEYSLQGQLTVRVPSERTQAFLRAVAASMPPEVPSLTARLNTRGLCAAAGRACAPRLASAARIRGCGWGSRVVMITCLD